MWAPSRDSWGAGLQRSHHMTGTFCLMTQWICCQTLEKQHSSVYDLIKSLITLGSARLVLSTQCLVRAVYRFSWRTSIRETWWRNGVLQVSAGLYWWVSLYNSAKLAIKHHKLASTRQSVIDVKLSFARVSSRLWLTDSGSSVWLN